MNIAPGNCFCVWGQNLPAIWSQGAKIRVGAGHATFAGLRTAQKIKDELIKKYQF